MKKIVITLAALLLIIPLFSGISANASHYRHHTYIKHEWNRPNQKYNHRLIGQQMMFNINYYQPFDHAGKLYNYVFLFNKPDFYKDAKVRIRFEKSYNCNKKTYRTDYFKAYKGLSTNNRGRYYKVISNTKPRMWGWVSSRGININNKSNDAFYSRLTNRYLNKAKFYANSYNKNSRMRKSGKSYSGFESYINTAIDCQFLIQDDKLRNKLQLNILFTTEKYGKQMHNLAYIPYNWYQLMKYYHHDWSNNN